MKITDWKKDNYEKIAPLAEIIYLLMFNMMLGIKMAGFYDGQTVFKLVFVAYAALFVAKMTLTDYTMKEYLFAAVLILFSGIVYVKTGEKGLFLCFSMMLGVKGVSIIKTLKIGAVISGVIMAVKIFLSAFGFVPEKYFATYRSGVGEQIRHSLGYVHPNTLHISFFILTILVLYTATKYRFHVFLVSVISFALNIYIYMYSGSRTGLLCSVAYIILNAWNYNRNHISLFEKIEYYLTYPATCVVTIVLPLVLSDKWFKLLDDYVFNFRFTMAKYYFEHNSLSLFGIRLNNPDQVPYSIDMAGMYLFLQLGIVAFVGISVLSIWYVKRAMELNMTAELSAFIAICIAGLWEPFLYNTSYKNIAFVFVGAAIFSMAIEEKSAAKEKTIHMEKRALVYMGIGFCAAVVAFSIYLLATDPYTTMYADQAAPIVDQNEAQEPIYMSQAEEQEAIENGALVLRYGEADAPLYEFSQETAYEEYKLRVMSVCTFAFMLVILLEYTCFYFKDKRNIDRK